jgi:hypothetical protein
VGIPLPGYPLSVVRRGRGKSIQRETTGDGVTI